MRKLFTINCLFIALFTFVNAQNGPEISFDIEKHDFGTVEEGPQITHEFVFTNTGTEPLVLSRVKASCGCTTPSWPKEPVMPGQQDTILVSYNTARRVGKFNKTISITSNASENPQKTLYISGNVEAAPEEETMPIKQPIMMAP